MRATVPAALPYPCGTVHVVVAWAARALGEAGRGASPTAGKREEISF